MDHNNNPYNGNNSNSQNNNSNFGINSNNIPFNPNLLNNPQVQSMLQWLNNPQNNINHQPSSLNLMFPMSQNLSQEMEHSPGGAVSSTATPTPTEEMRSAQHLEDLNEVVVELFPDGSNTNIQQPTKQLKMPWTIKEDEALVSCYINAGGDVGEGTYQTKTKLWETIGSLYEQAQQDNPAELNKRSKKGLQNRWDHINGIVSKWVGVYAECKRNKRSGQTEEDIENDAHTSYQKLGSGKFTLMHAWKIMRTKKKWSAGTMQIPNDSEGSSKRSQPDVEVDVEEGRPIGVKKAKKKGKEATSSSMLDLDNFTSTLEEISERRHDLGERMYSLIRDRAIERKKEKEEETKLKLFSILAAQPHRDSDDEELYKKLKDEVRGKFF